MIYDIRFKRKDGVVRSLKGNVIPETLVYDGVNYTRHSVADNRALYVENGSEPAKLKEPLLPRTWERASPIMPRSIHGQSAQAIGPRTFLVGVVAGALIHGGALPADPALVAKVIVSQADAILDRMQWPNGKPGESTDEET